MQHTRPKLWLAFYYFNSPMKVLAFLCSIAC